HLFHVQCSCTYRNGRVTRLAWQDGYDGVTVLHYDFTAKRFVATEPFARAEVDRRNQNADYTASVPRRIEGLCGKIKQTAEISNFTEETLGEAHWSKLPLDPKEPPTKQRDGWKRGPRGRGRGDGGFRE
ncbi:hypothetical protein chiPu_0030992, partial [Chiloscyllium punctatum]|nr:hypothetical protein [Chiloscyllium punctatum]